MKNLLKKELFLAANPLSFLFIAFAAITLIPNYPLLVGSFFVCLGIFQTFQSSRENCDTLYTAMLPIRKKDVVTARFLLVFLIQTAAFLLDAVLVGVRMAYLNGKGAYADPPLMNANLVYLAFVLVVFAVFNRVFIVGFYKTAYAVGKPFLLFGIAAFGTVCIAEALHHFPGLGWLNSGEALPSQAFILAAGAAIYAAATLRALKISQRLLESIDL